MLKDFAISIIRTLRERGHKAYLVGGCVRDLLLGREPADYDVTTDAVPEQVMRIFPETYAVGAQFGVVLVPAPEKDEHQVPRLRPNFAERSSDSARDDRTMGVVEVATFRCDIGYSDGRHPDEVRFSKDPREDVERRDFTINGLLLDPITNEVLDYVGGRRDLDARNYSDHWRSSKAFRRGQTAYVACGSFCGAFRLRDRAQNIRGDSTSWRRKFIRFRASACAMSSAKC